MISILLSVVAASCAYILGASLFISGMYTGQDKQKEALISFAISVIAFITFLGIISLIW